MINSVLVACLVSQVLGKKQSTTAFWQTFLANTVNFEAEAGEVEVSAASAKIFYQMFSKRGRSFAMPDPRDPLLVWIGGGPGYSSQGPALEEFGPLTVVNVNNKSKVLENPFSWNEHLFLLFPDIPDTGFSRSSRANKTTNSALDTAKAMNSFLEEFFKEHASMRGLPIYVGGNGFGGKVAVIMANRMLNEGKLSVRGVILGGPEVDPTIQNNNFDGMLYAAGVVDRSYRDSLAWYQNRMLRELMRRNASEAYNCYHFLVENKTNLENYAAGVNINNFRQVDTPFDESFAAFLNSSKGNFSTVEDFISYNHSVHQ
jgi:carboxypeptidase C (cathepsin A)